MMPLDLFDFSKTQIFDTNAGIKLHPKNAFDHIMHSRAIVDELLAQDIHKVGLVSGGGLHNLIAERVLLSLEMDVVWIPLRMAHQNQLYSIAELTNLQALMVWNEVLLYSCVNQVNLPVKDISTHNEYTNEKDHFDKIKENKKSSNIIFLSSGSTGHPLPKQHSIVRFEENVLAASRHYQFEGDFHVLSLLDESYAFERCYQTLFFHEGFAFTYADRSKSILDNLGESNANLFTITPSLLHQLVVDLESSKHIYECIAICSGAALDLALQKRAEACGIEVLTMYGASDCLMISANTQHNKCKGSVGQLIEEDHVRLQEGKVEYKRKEATGLVWCALEDLGALDENGFLHLHGRVSETIKTAEGLFVHLDTLEKELEKVTNGCQCVIYPNPQYGLDLVCITDSENMSVNKKALIVWNEEHERHKKLTRIAQITRADFNTFIKQYNKLNRRKLAADLEEQMRPLYEK
jgi:long-subunit acyl-CoA synthetase (AMP-forming)